MSPLSASEKIALASCLLLLVFLTPTMMLLPLLRGRKDRKSGGKSEWQALDGLLRPPGSKDAQSMEELARQVEQFKREKEAPAQPSPEFRNLGEARAADHGDTDKSARPGNS